jgi:hypothetical protein
MMTTAANGPQFPDMEDVWRMRDAVTEADRAGYSGPEYGRLLLSQRQTDVAYLRGYDRSLLAAREAIPDEPEAEASQ